MSSSSTGSGSRWAKHDAAMTELYERVEREKVEKDAEIANAAAEERTNAAARAQYLASAASSSETTLVPTPLRAMPTPHEVAAARQQQRETENAEKALNAWDRYIRWSAKFYKTNLYDKPKPGTS